MKYKPYLTNQFYGVKLSLNSTYANLLVVKNQKSIKSVTSLYAWLEI